MSRAGNIVAPFIRGQVTDTESLVVKSTNIDDRIELLMQEIDAGVADPVVRQILGQILKTVPPKDHEGELRAIFNWVRKNIRYTHDPYNRELFQRPRRAIELGLGDCDDQTIVTASMASSIGFPIRLRVIGVNNSEPEHIYPVAGLPPQSPTGWIPMDASVDEDMGWEYPRENAKYSEDYEYE